MHLRVLVVTTLIFSTAAFAQEVSPTTATLDGPFLVRYASNLAAGDSVVNITNTGARGAGLAAGTSASTTGAICANVYTFSPDEQLISCCSCPVTPNGLVSLSAKADLVSNTLTPAVPNSIVIKILGTAPVGGSCAGSAAAPGPLASGLLAWGATLHSTVTPAAAPFSVTESEFLPGSLSPGEFARITSLCNFIAANGSGFGVCRSCRLGGLGGSNSQ
jgi:hypothetical protein